MGKEYDDLVTKAKIGHLGIEIVYGGNDLTSEVEKDRPSKEGFRECPKS